MHSHIHASDTQKEVRQELQRLGENLFHALLLLPILAGSPWLTGVSLQFLPSSTPSIILQVSPLIRTLYIYWAEGPPNLVWLLTNYICKDSVMVWIMSTQDMLSSALNSSEDNLIWKQCLYQGDQVTIRLIREWALIQYDWYPSRNGKREQRETHTEGKDERLTENILYKPRSASGQQNPGEKQKRNRSPLTTLWKNQLCQPPDLGF